MSDAPVADRLRAAAAIAMVSADALIEDLADAGGGLTDAIAFTDADVETLGAEVTLPEDPWLARRAAQLADGISPSKALSRAALARRGLIRAGFGIGTEQRSGRGLAGWSSSLSITGQATLDDDLAAATAIALSPAARQALSGRIRALTGDDPGPRPRILRTVIYGVDVLGHHTTVELGAPATPTLIERLVEVAPAFELDATHLVALTSAHALLRGEEPPWIRVPAIPERAVPGGTVTYGAQPAEIALRVVGILARTPEAIIRFGAWMDTLGASSVDSFELVLGSPGHPLGTRIGVSIRA
ncbi:MAG: hypothetical protein H0T42_04525 [Deltaproteobacteria bacterium]|nr:hypothetical protein [Deltaproteobacteria bacterium]